MDEAWMVSTARARAGLETDEEARTLIQAVFQVLGELLPGVARRPIAAQLPPGLASALEAEPSTDFDAPELYRRVAQLTGLPEGFAVEQTQIACQLLAEALNGEGRAQLHKHLPVDIAALCVPRETSGPAPEHRRPGHGHTVASGRGGSRHPVSEGRPGPQADSVASPNPHGDTKLSSAAGLTQEREHESVAEGTVGSTRPLSDSGSDES